jgi:hypothetical protein
LPMRKLFVTSLSAFAGGFVAIVLLGVPLGVRAVGEPATDERFCADSNGDGEVNITDSLDILNFLFNGTSTPYCIAQGQPLPAFATREELGELQAQIDTLQQRVTNVPRLVSGSYVGDGNDPRTIETGVTGTIRSLWVAGRCARVIEGVCDERSHYFFESWVSSDMEPGISWGQIVPSEVLSGSSFVTEPNSQHNFAYMEYIWLALVEPE